MTPPAVVDVEAAMEELRAVAARRREHLVEADGLYQRQVELCVELRERVDPPMLLKDIAAAIGGKGGTVVGVDAAIRKWHEQQGDGARRGR